MKSNQSLARFLVAALLVFCVIPPNAAFGIRLGPAKYLPEHQIEEHAKIALEKEGHAPHSSNFPGLALSPSTAHCRGFTCTGTYNVDMHREIHSGRYIIHDLDIAPTERNKLFIERIDYRSWMRLGITNSGKPYVDIELKFNPAYFDSDEVARKFTLALNFLCCEAENYLKHPELAAPKTETHKQHRSR